MMDQPEGKTTKGNLNSGQVLDVDQLRVALVQIVEDAGQAVAEAGQQALHGLVGEVGGSEELAGGAEGFQVLQEGPAHAAASHLRADVKEGDEALLEEGVLQDGIAQHVPVHGEVNFASGQGAAQEGLAAGGGIQGEQGGKIGGSGGTEGEQGSPKQGEKLRYPNFIQSY